MNLWKETLDVLTEHGKTFDDVVAIRGHLFRITKDDFRRYANAEYYEGFGAQEVAPDLLVIGTDFWLERHEYDGSEWWEFKEMPKYDSYPIYPIKALMRNQRQNDDCGYICGWQTLEELNPHLIKEGADDGRK